MSSCGGMVSGTYQNSQVPFSAFFFLRDFSGFHNCLYGALSAIRDKDQQTCEDALERGHRIVAESLTHASLESIHSVYPLLDQLQALKEMHEVQALAFGQEPLDAVLSRWNDHQRSIETSFDITEMTFKLRLSGLRLLLTIAEESLKVMKSFESSLGSDSPGNLQWNRWLLEAEMFWAKSETSTALHLIRALIDKLSKAVDICEAASSTRSTAMTAYLTLARFADAQYQHIVNYMKSPEFESKKGILTKYRSNVEQLTVMGDLKTRYYRNLQKQGELDQSEMESLLQDRSRYLNSSAECYLKYLKASSAS
ncbi:ataxia telangiectasia mutated [Apostichopus japonicus]|uniref:Ataxia telangiectasia mutated n=1 Tax=Stichopus japonicus TaxID=307972 RepID=A0A2G8L3X2_STIJA|nr:ataxia telangiectasia mutated [Apostichopus japonicus]